MRIAAGGEFPSGDLELAHHGARVSGKQVVDVVRVDRALAPREIGKPQRREPRADDPDLRQVFVVAKAICIAECTQCFAHGLAGHRRVISA